MKRKDIVINCIELIILFVVIMIYNTFFYSGYDHIVDFTHTYSIANGLSIYKDFNIVIGPVYPMLMALFLVVFGKNLIVFNTINSLIVVCIYYLIKKNNKHTFSLFILLSFCIVLFAKYNTFILLLFYILYFLELRDFKYKDYIIGIVLSLIIFTKISVGICLIIPTIILYYKKPRVILKRLLTIFIISSLFLLLMHILGVLPDFINYTVLGLFDFADISLSTYKTALLIIMLIILLLGMIFLIKAFKKDKFACYYFFFFSMALPSFDFNHTMLAIVPTIIYFVDSKRISKRIRIVCYSIFAIFYISLIINSSSNIDLLKIDCENKYCSQNYIFNYSFDNVHKINEELKKEYSDYTIYYFNLDAYFYKLDLHENINKYDFIWNGNMGFNGSDKYIKEINNYCNSNRCLFIINESIIKDNKEDLISLKILKHVSKKYEKKGNLFYKNVSIYSN